MIHGQILSNILWSICKLIQFSFLRFVCTNAGYMIGHLNIIEWDKNDFTSPQAGVKNVANDIYLLVKT